LTLARRTHTCLPPTAVGNNDLHQCKVKVAYPIIRLAHASLIEIPAKNETNYLTCP
jgi:hypothetical protein